MGEVLRQFLKIDEHLIPVLRDGQQASDDWGPVVCSRLARFGVYAPDVPTACCPIRPPVANDGEEEVVHSHAMVKIPRDVLKQSSFGVQIEVVVVGEYPNPVPLPQITISRLSPQKGVDIDPVADFVGEGGVVGVGEKVNEVSEKLVATSEFFLVVGQGGVCGGVPRSNPKQLGADLLPTALVKLAVVVPEPCLDEFLVDLFHIVEDAFHLGSIIDGQPDMIRAACRQPKLS